MDNAPRRVQLMAKYQINSSQTISMLELYIKTILHAFNLYSRVAITRRKEIKYHFEITNSNLLKLSKNIE